MHKNSSKLNKNLIKEAQQFDVVRKEFEKKEKKFKKDFTNLESRVSHILNKLADVYKIRIGSWSFSNCCYDDLNSKYDSSGYFVSAMLLEKDFLVCVNFDIDRKSHIGNFDSKIIINDGEYEPFKVYQDYVGSQHVQFPTRWIFEDFEEELKKSKILYEIGKK